MRRKVVHRRRPVPIHSLLVCPFLHYTYVSYPFSLSLSLSLYGLHSPQHNTPLHRTLVVCREGRGNLQDLIDVFGIDNGGNASSHPSNLGGGQA